MTVPISAAAVSARGRDARRALRAQLALEIGWLENDQEDALPSMVRPVQRMALQYVYSSGDRREYYVENARPVTVGEATPLLPAIVICQRASWQQRHGACGPDGPGLAVFSPATRKEPMRVRCAMMRRRRTADRIVNGAAVVSLGNLAISYGNEAMQWGPGYYGQLAQSTNASAFPALRFQNIHPGHLPSFLRYLGLMRFNAFLGQLDGASRVCASVDCGPDRRLEAAAGPGVRRDACDRFWRTRQ